MASNAKSGGEVTSVYDVAVVGSGGFLGTAAAAAIAASGAHVEGFTKARPVVVDGDLATDAAVLVWCVGLITPQRTDLAEEQLSVFAEALDAAGRAERVPHVVLVSSGGAVYGPPSVAPFAESEPPHPANRYGEVKLAEERALAASGLDHTMLRIANPYGPGQTGATGQGVVGAWLHAIRAGAPVPFYGDGSVTRDYVFIEDCADAIAITAERRPGGIINIGSGAGTSLAELLSVVEESVAPRPVHVDRRPARGVDPADAWLVVSRAAEVLGWRATTSLADGVARTWAGAA